MSFTHDKTVPRSALWNSAHTTGDEEEGDHLVYDGVEWIAAPPDGGEVLMVTGVTDPPDPLLNSASDDWLYAS